MRVSHKNIEVEFEQAFKTLFVPLTHFAQKYISDLDTAKDIVHGVFINLWEKREDVDLNKSLKSYLFTSTYNRCLNYIRDNKKFDKEELTINILEQNTSTESEDKLISDETQQQIKQAIDKLPVKCKEIFILSRFEELKYSEIAKQLNISIKTVEAQMSKALKVLREELKDLLILLIILNSIKF